MGDIPQIYVERENYSRRQLNDLKKQLSDLDELNAFKNITIFGVGSYARLEAGHYSDLDLFFLSSGSREEAVYPRTSALRLFGRIIETAKTMGFPEFSNDCEYLTILHTNDILENIGSRNDDHENYFTARMLLLLESHCLFNADIYETIIEEIVRSYFIDYPDHQQTFSPIFLINDIDRFWKTLLLNYENKRKLKDESPEKKTKQKVRNFKLKFSRMTTCYASIASLGSYKIPVENRQVLDMVKLTPRQRIQEIASRIPNAATVVRELLDSYSWFLEMTALPSVNLEEHFNDRDKRTEMWLIPHNCGLLDLRGAEAFL